MEQCERKIKMERYFLKVLFWLSIALCIVIGELGGRVDWILDGREITSFAHMIQSVLILGWLIFLRIRIRKCGRLLQNDYLLTEYHLQQSDERERYIDGVVGKYELQLLIVGLGVATFFATFLNMTVFYTCFSILCFIIIIKYFFKWYLDMKY